MNSTPVHPFSSESDKYFAISENLIVHVKEHPPTNVFNSFPGFDGMEPPTDRDPEEDAINCGADSSSASKTAPPFTSTIPRNMDPTKINRDRFFLILGIATEALCSPTSTQPDAGLLLSLLWVVITKVNYPPLVELLLPWLHCY